MKKRGIILQLCLWGMAISAQKKSDVAAFVWPSYHPDDRAKTCWPDGIGEWQTVKSHANHSK